MSDEEIQVASQTGRTRTGAPLSWSRAPAPDLRPWLYGWSISVGELPPGIRVECCRIDELPCLTIIFEGAWTAETVREKRVWDPKETGLALYFGAHSRRINLGIEGKYIALTLYFTAGSPAAMGFPPQSEMIDRIIDFDQMLGRKVPLASLIPLDRDYASWADVVEDELRSHIKQNGIGPPDPLATAFERKLLAHPAFGIEEFAGSENVSRRTLERCVKRTFGLTPKQAVRRGRALDLAAKLLGVTLPEEEEMMELRFFDQSHQIREMKHFFDMTPREIQTGFHPFLTLNMESRQRRRLAALKSLSLKETPEWRDPAAEPPASEN